MPKRYTSRKRTVRKKSRKSYRRFRRYRTGTRAKAKSYFRLRRAAKNYSKTRKIKRAKRQYKYTAGKGVKNKIKHLKMSEFALLPFYDLARLSASVVSGNLPNMYNDFPAEQRQQYFTTYLAYWYKYGAILPEAYFNSSSPFVIGSNKGYPPYLYAFNPILSPVTCGNKMQLYAALYRKFKYVGIKVSWHPIMRSSSNVIPSKTTTTPAKKNDGTYYKETYQAVAVGPATTINTQLQDPGTTGLQLDPATSKQSTETMEWMPVAVPNLYMHVYFGKQINDVESWDLPFLLKQQGTSQTGALVNNYSVSAVIYNHDDKRRFKAAPYYDYNTMLPCIEKDSKLYKVYDMSKPFSFFVRPMVSTNVADKEAPTKELEQMDNFNIVASKDELEVLQKGLKHLGYKEFVHALTPPQLEIPQDNYSALHLTDKDDKFYNRWAYLTNDDNFFNPIMFWYCFTTSDNYVPNTPDMTDPTSSRQLFSTVRYNGDFDGDNKNAKLELSARPCTESNFLNNYGYFDVTFYTKWKEERPLVSKTSYVGIVPSDTGVEGITSIIAPN